MPTDLQVRQSELQQPKTATADERDGNGRLQSNSRLVTLLAVGSSADGELTATGTLLATVGEEKAPSAASALRPGPTPIVANSAAFVQHRPLLSRAATAELRAEGKRMIRSIPVPAKP
jgi:hypothetical protein